METKTYGIKSKTGMTQLKAAKVRKPEEVYSLSYSIIGGDNVMPIGGWWGPYTPQNKILPNFVNQKYFSLIKECGINVITVSPDYYGNFEESVNKSLSICTELEMGYYVYDKFIADVNNICFMKERLKHYYDSESCIGVHIYDEPLPDTFDNIAKVYDEYEKLSINDKHLYTNLLPVYGKSVIEKFDIDYEKYVETFLNKVKTKFLSYDYYPFYYKGEGTNTSKQYYYNLSVTRMLAKKYKIPLWVFVQAGGQWQYIGKPSVELYPDRYELFWNVNSNLAFGAKSIQYFTLIQPEVFMLTDSTMDYRRIGLIGGDGKNNIWYNYAKEINCHIASIDEVLMNSQNCGVLPVGVEAEKDIIGEELITKTFRELISVKGNNIIIGCFDFRGKTALYAVNNSTVNHDCGVLDFDSDYCYSVTKNAEKKEIKGYRLIIKLEPGEGVLIELL